MGRAKGGGGFSAKKRKIGAARNPFTAKRPYPASIIIDNTIKHNGRFLLLRYTEAIARTEDYNF